MPMDQVRPYHVDETSAHGSNNPKKRTLCLDEDTNIIEQPSKKTCNSLTASISRDYKHRKKDKQEEIKWKKDGHLPRLSTLRKYLGHSQQWKTPSLISNFRPKAGGYTAMAKNIIDLPEIQSLEQGIALDFKVIKCNGL
jgi:hypothetical protein